MNETMTVGEYIQLCRRRRKKTLADLSAMTGISIATISRIENDRDAMFNTVCLLARALDINIAALANCVKERI
jgi:transcriptional regulator with XRE-family HTH domain